MEYWLLAAYVIGSVAGYVIGEKRARYATTERVIDSLIEKGYLKTDAEGNPEKCE